MLQNGQLTLEVDLEKENNQIKLISYQIGIFPTSSCSSSYFAQDHCVQLVAYEGYGSSDGYWIVRVRPKIRSTHQPFHSFIYFLEFLGLRLG